MDLHYPHYRREGAVVLVAMDEDSPYQDAARFYGEDGAEKAELFLGVLTALESGGES